MFSKLVWRSVWGRRRRMLLAWAALLVPATLATAGMNFLLDASAKLRTEVRTDGPNLVARSSGPPVPLESFGRFLACPYVEALEGRGELRVGPRRTQAAIVHVNAERVRRMWGWDLRRGALVGRRLAERLRVQKGDRVLLEGREIEVDGILENEGEEEGALFLADSPASVSRIEFVVDGGAEAVDRAAAEMRKDVAGVSVAPIRALTAAQGAIVDRLGRVFAIALVLVLALAALGTAASFSALVEEQRREIGVVTALGARPGQLARFLVAQGGVLLGGALAAGLPLGLGLSELLGRRVFGLGTSVRPAALAAAVGVCGAAALLGLIVPVRRALAVQPAEVLREE